MRLLLVLFLMGTVLAFPAEKGGDSKGGKGSGQQEAGGQKGGGQQGNGQQSGQQGNKGNKTCDAATAAKVGRLSGGIRANVAIQGQELISIATLTGLLASNGTQNPNEVAIKFESERQALMVIQKMGVDIRAQNSKIAAEVKSPSENGLKIVEQAQQTEIQQVSTLGKCREADAKMLQVLSQEVLDGTRQNWFNLVTADAQCP